MKPNYSILLVEDNEGDLLLIKEALEATGIPKYIKSCKDGQSAIDYFQTLIKGPRTDYPNIVFLDINLPKRNGHEVLRFIKNTPEFKHIIVAMFTTSSSERDVQLAYQNSANCYIVKPAELEEFMNIIRQTEDFWFSTSRLPKA